MDTPEPIKLRGFFLSISLPSEGLFQRRFRDEEIIIETVKKEFDLISQNFISRFKSLRSKVYNKILPRYTIKIQKTRSRAVYFMPNNQAAPFFEEIDDLRKEYADLQAEIDAYLTKREDDWLRKVEQYTRKKNLRGTDYCPDLPSRVQIDLTPLELSPTLFRDFIQSETQRQELREVELILRHKYEDTIRTSVRELETKLAELIERLSRTISITKIRKNSLATAKEALHELEELTKSANLDSILGASFKHANLLIDVMEEDGSEETREGLMAATVELANSYGYEVADSQDFDPRITLEHISLQMRKDLSPRVKALLEEVL